MSCIKTVIKTKLRNYIGKIEFIDNILLEKEEKHKYKLLTEEYINIANDCDQIYIFGVDEYSVWLGKKLASKFKGNIAFENEALECNGCKALDVNELLFVEDLRNKKIIVTPCRKMVKKLELLLDLGIKWEQIILSNDWTEQIGGKGFNSYDCMLGYSRCDDLPGFTIFEDKESSDSSYTIAVLGGSTTDPYTSNVVSWSEFLFYQLRGIGLDVKIICGGLNAYHSGQEFMKLFRDVLPMEPDMVISYSGINDTPYFKRRHLCKEYPYVMMHQKEFLEKSVRHAVKRGMFKGNAYHEEVTRLVLGIPDDKDAASLWVRNERMMHALCQEFNIKFYCFLQPCRDYGGYVKTGEPEKLSFKKDLNKNIEEINAWYEDVRKQIGDIDYIIDMSEMFRGQSNIFYDFCHVFEGANKKIASNIYKYIIKDIRKDLNL